MAFEQVEQMARDIKAAKRTISELRKENRRLLHVNSKLLSVLHTLAGKVAIGPASRGE